MKPKRLALFRALLPSWKFFDRTDVPHALYFRHHRGTEPWSEWREALPPRPHGFATLFLNPRGNDRLALASIVEEVLHDAERAADPSELESQVSYRLLVRLAHLQSPASDGAVQFKVSYVNDQREAFEDALVSKVHRASEP